MERNYEEERLSVTPTTKSNGIPCDEYIFGFIGQVVAVILTMRFSHYSSTTLQLASKK